MKKTLTTILPLVTLATTLFAQPKLERNSVQTGLTFTLYTISGVSTSNIAPSGANATWDISTGTATEKGTASLEDMTSTNALKYPDANFAIKFTPTGGADVYSLFRLTASVMEEVANNVGVVGETAFTDYRTAFVFPFTFGLANSDSYQKQGQSAATKTNTYDAYGTLTSSLKSNPDLIRIMISDNGKGSAMWVNTTPFYPVLEVNSDGFTLWQNTTTGLKDAYINDFYDMYPNPATNQLTIINKVSLNKIEIVSLDGRLQFTSTQSQIDISGLNAGTYLLKAYSTQGISTRKFVKQ
jgi:hypothetical protein